MSYNPFVSIDKSKLYEENKNEEYIAELLRKYQKNLKPSIEGPGQNL